MWNAIRSDLKEFASSIATDGNTVLENIDSKLKEADMDLSVNSNTGLSNNNDSAPGTAAQTVSIQDALLAIDPEVASTAMAAPSPNAATTTTNTNNTLQNDHQLDDAVHNAMLADAQVEAFRRMEMDVTYLTPLLDAEVNGVKDQSSTTVIADKEAVVDLQEGTADQEINPTEASETTELTENIQEGNETTANNDDENSEKEQDDENVVQESNVDDDDDDNDNDDGEDDEGDDDYEKDVKEYLSSFNIESKTDEISKLLAQQPFLAQHFENLVPVQVTYEQFWQRYFYRCDPVRIVKEWEEEDKRLRLQRQELIGKGVKSVQNIFGGALKAIKGVTAAAGQDANNAAGSGTSIYEKYQAELEAKQKAMLAPQTAQSEQDDKKMSVGSGLLGNALGMFAGSNGRPPFVLNTTEHDDDDDDDDEAYEDNNEEEELEEEEEELGWGSDDDLEYDDEEEEYEDDNGDNNEILNDSQQETIVFEDKLNSDGVIQEIENLKAMLEEAQGSKHQAEVKAQSLQSQLDELKAQIQQERNDSKVQEDEGQVSASEFEKSEDRDILVKQHEAEMKSANDQITKLQSQLLGLESNLQEEKGKSKKLEEELTTCKEEMKKQSLNFAKMLEDELEKARSERKDVVDVSPSSVQEGSSLSSAVEVPPASEPMQKAQADFEEDGWGGSWSDDE